MKWVFIMLLAANLVYMGWELDRQTAINLKQNSEALTVPPHVKRLALVKELSSPPEPRVSAEAQHDFTDDDNFNSEIAAQTYDTPEEDVKIEEKYAQDLLAQLPDISVPERTEAPEDASPLCFSYGPFPDEKQSIELNSWFEQRNVIVQQRQEQDTENNLFWIYLAPQNSLDGAMQAIEDLKQKGIGDYRLIKTGDLRHAISLGLFSSQASVNKRLNELKGKGYQPIVVPHQKVSLIYWLDVKLAGQRDILNQMLIDYPSRYNSLPVDCSEIAIPQDAH